LPKSVTGQYSYLQREMARQAVAILENICAGQSDYATNDPKKVSVQTIWHDVLTVARSYFPYRCLSPQLTNLAAPFATDFRNHGPKKLPH